MQAWLCRKVRSDTSNLNEFLISFSKFTLERLPSTQISSSKANIKTWWQILKQRCRFISRINLIYIIEMKSSLRKHRKRHGIVSTWRLQRMETYLSSYFLRFSYQNTLKISSQNTMKELKINLIKSKFSPSFCFPRNPLIQLGIKLKVHNWNHP